MYYTYILKCSNSSYYTGSTENLANRIRDHNSGKGAEYTFKNKPCFLVWYNKHSNLKEAILQEKQIKKISRVKKEKLIFEKNSTWQHYKGHYYFLLDEADGTIFYSECETWKAYLNKKDKKGEEVSVWARSKMQWLDLIEKDNKKVLRFVRLAE